MKYIKKFESQDKPKFNVGDIVIVRNTSSLNGVNFIVKTKDNKRKYYDLISLDINGNIIKGIAYNNYPESELRKLTPEELKKLKLMKDINKYNL